MLARLLIPVLGVGVVGQILAGALTFLLPVTVGGGPAGNRRLTAILERGWRARAILGNAGVLALITLPSSGWTRTVAWVAVLAGFGTFPVLAASALVAARAGASGLGRERAKSLRSDTDRLGTAGREPQQRTGNRHGDHGPRGKA